jgi:hypothetical protein
MSVSYLGVNVGDACSFLAVEAQINFRITEELFAHKRLIVRGALVSGRGNLFDLQEEVLLFQT